jgi:hypothetical protein
MLGEFEEQICSTIDIGCNEWSPRDAVGESKVICSTGPRMVNPAADRSCSDRG